MRVAKAIELDAQMERELRVLSQRPRVEVRLQQRARIVLLAAKGLQNKDIALEVGLDRRQVALWRQRFLEGSIEALRKDAPRSGRPASVMQEMESRPTQRRPKPFIWTASASDILAKITRAKAALAAVSR